MKLKMTIDEALEFADECSRGRTIHEESQGWRVVCMMLAEEVRMRRKVECICVKCGLRQDGDHVSGKEKIYNTDERGEYRITDRWVRAWAGGGQYVGRFSICELREYADGSSSVHVDKPIYIRDYPALEFAYSVYLKAQKEMGV